MWTTSTTTWTFKREEPFALARRYADEEGTCLLYSGDEIGYSYLALFPDKKIEVPLTPNCWEELEAQVDSDLYFGFLSYEMGCYSDSCHITHHPSNFPAALFYRPTTLIVFNHSTNVATLYGKSIRPSEKKGEFLAQLRSCSETLSSYLEKVRTILKHIKKGDVYQVNFSQQFNFEWSGSSFALFENCAGTNPYAAYLHTPNFSLVSASPEMFVHKEGNVLRTAPIKGTAPRGSTPQEEAENQKRLLASEKERAELTMIVDLLRNDLSKVCFPVEVEKLCSLERFPDVFHLVSTLKGVLRKPLHPISILRHLFPGGSISGCPKLSAMRLISQLENAPRGPYTGCVGFLNKGEMHFNIAIRTAIVEQKCLSLRLGGGIVADSDPLAEYEETLHKGRTFFQKLEQYADTLSQ
ncbi:MAG: chorismate-binding protein [Chlamydiales bacterium]|nr:chorismate-binding protein [Chlamydiales bacterium]